MLRKPITWFILSYILFQVILFGMRNEHQVFWHLITGLMLLASISYVFYQRHIDSSRIPYSLLIGIGASIAIVIVHTLLSYAMKDIHYFYVLKTLVSIGVAYKWQLIISLVITVPLHELYMRSLLQDELMDRFNLYIAVLITALASTGLFIWTLNIQLLIFIFIVQIILAVSYALTKRLITPMTGQILAIILLILIHAH